MRDLIIRAHAALAAQIRAFCRAACLYEKQLGGTLHLLMLHVYLRDAGGKTKAFVLLGGTQFAKHGVISRQSIEQFGRVLRTFDHGRPWTKSVAGRPRHGYPRPCLVASHPSTCRS